MDADGVEGLPARAGALIGLLSQAEVKQICPGQEQSRIAQFCEHNRTEGSCAEIDTYAEADPVAIAPTSASLEDSSVVGRDLADLLVVPGALRLHLGTAGAALASPSDGYVRDTAPWVNVNRHFGAAIRTGRVVPVTPNPGWAATGQTLKDGGVYMVSGDWPGWARSLDGAQRFESAVSRRVSSKNVCGGHDAEWFGGTTLSASALVCDKQPTNECVLADSTVTKTNYQTWATTCEYGNEAGPVCQKQVQCSTNPNDPTNLKCRYCDGGEKQWCMKCTGGPEDALVNRDWPEAGPPSSLIAFHGAAAASGRDVASGPAPADLDLPELQSMCRGPANQTGCAKSIMYTGNDWWTFFSPDAGRDWFRLTPQCEMSQQVGWGGIAADRGLVGVTAHKGAHLVALATKWDKVPVPGEASGCAVNGILPKNCARRSIAWTDNVGPELAESMKATMASPAAWKGQSNMERAGGGGADFANDVTVMEWAGKAKWRYASINHLPAAASVGGMCKVYQGLSKDMLSTSPFQASIPSTTCAADLKSRCHGRRAAKKTATETDTTPLDRDAWCLDYNNAACACTDGPPADCRYPNPTSVEIDPRNGWAYLSTDVGLLSSPSGGRRWIRQGGAPQSNPADVFKAMTSLDNFEDNVAILGAKLYTKQYQCGPSEAAPCNQDPDVSNSMDLNANPDRITLVGRMSLTFTPCATEAYYAPKDGKPARHRGHLVATVPVEWIATPAAGVTQRVSSVFVAMQKGECDATVPVDEPGPLVFWDTAHLELKAIGHSLPSCPSPAGRPVSPQIPVS